MLAALFLTRRANIKTVRRMQTHSQVTLHVTSLFKADSSSEARILSFTAVPKGSQTPLHIKRAKTSSSLTELNKKLWFTMDNLQTHLTDDMFVSSAFGVICVRTTSWVHYMTPSSLLTCRSFWGFQSESKMMQVSAAVRLIPRPPALVHSRKTKRSESGLQNLSMAACRRFPLTRPSMRSYV